MLLIDGVRYEAWTPQNECDFEQVVKEHAKDIFGEQSIYLDIRHKLRTKSGIGSIPDGYVIIFGDEPHWHIVEVELSSHPLYEHIVPQVSRFINGIKNPSTQKDIVSALYQEIDSDEFLRLRLKNASGTTETYKFLSDLLSKSPVVTIIIEKRTEQLDEAISALAHSQIKVVEFQTFTREGVDLTVHAHLFEPVYIVPPQQPLPPSQKLEKPEYVLTEPYLKKEKKERVVFTPTKIGEGKGGWTIVDIKGGRYLCKSDANRYEVCVAPWTKDYKKIAGPIKDEAVARSILETGKVP